MTEFVHVIASSSASVVASDVIVIAVGLHDKPGASSGVEPVLMGLIKPISCDNDAFVLLGSSEDEVAKRVDLLCCEMVPSALERITVGEHITRKPGNFFVACEEHHQVFNETFIIQIKLSLVDFDRESIGLHSSVDSYSSSEHNGAEVMFAALEEVCVERDVSQLRRVVKIHDSSVNNRAIQHLGNYSGTKGLELVDRVN